VNDQNCITAEPRGIQLMPNPEALTEDPSFLTT